MASSPFFTRFKYHFGVVNPKYIVNIPAAIHILLYRIDGAREKLSDTKTKKARMRKPTPRVIPLTFCLNVCMFIPYTRNKIAGTNAIMATAIILPTTCGEGNHSTIPEAVIKGVSPNKAHKNICTTATATGRVQKNFMCLGFRVSIANRVAAAAATPDPTVKHMPVISIWVLEPVVNKSK